MGPPQIKISIRYARHNPLHSSIEIYPQVPQKASKICRNLITKTGRGLVLSVDDDFRKKKDFRHIIFSAEVL